MKKINNHGISLIEAIVATGIGVAMMVWLNSLIASDTKANREYESLAYAATDASSVSQEIKRFLNRGRGRVQADVGITQVGAAATGFWLNRSGAFIFNADLRPCGQPDPTGFNPATSAANFSRVVLLCCDQQMALAANLPGGGTLNLNSACTNSQGLSIQTYEGTVLRSSVCKRDITEMYIRRVGTDPSTSGGRILGFDFTVRTRKLSSGQLIEGSQRLNYSLAGSLSNDIDSFAVTCQP